MSEEEENEEPLGSSQEPTPLPPPVPEEEEEEGDKPLDLSKLLSGKKGGKFEMGDVMAYAIFTDIMDRREERRQEREWKREQREEQRKNPQRTSPSPEIQSLKGEFSELRKTVNDLVETLAKQEQSEAQKNFVEGVVKQTTDSIMPELQAIKNKLAEYDQKIAAGEKPSTSLEDLRRDLIAAVDRMGEKAGAGGKTLTDVTGDVDKILTLVDIIEKRLKHGGEGEVDFRTMAVSTFGEIGKEIVSAYRDIETSRREGEGGAGVAQPPQEQTPASAMQAIIKRQVQNFILQKMQGGATTLNVKEAAQTLGITVGQVTWAYNQLMNEGWFHVQIPSSGKGKKVKGNVGEEEGQATEEASEPGDNIFEPPPE